MRGRKCWLKKGQTTAWWNKSLNNEVMDSDWLENFRMFKTSFEELVNTLRPYLNQYQKSVKLLLSCITSVMKPPLVRQQMPLLYHVI